MRKIDWSARLRSKEFIVAIAALLGMIANSAFGITPAEWNMYVTLVLGVLITGGVIADPTTPGITDSNEVDAPSSEDSDEGNDEI